MITFVRSGLGALVLVVLAAVAGAGGLFRARLLAHRRGIVTASAATSGAPSVSASAPPSGLGALPSSDRSSDEPSALGAVPAALPPLPAYARLDPKTASVCADGMVLVDGDFCPAVAHFCADWVGDDPTESKGSRGPKRCRRYKKKLVCEGDLAHLHVCIDRFEYPNLAGVRPAALTNYRDAVRACSVEGKRLCEADEWTLACEGPEMWPYPNGLERDPKACTIDRPRRVPNAAALARPSDVSLEFERLDQRVASGQGAGCASRYGAFDLVGNVAEWVHDRHGQRGAERSDIGLAGGGWEAAVSTCRAIASIAQPTAGSYATGFRCCADAKDGVPPRKKR